MKKLFKNYEYEFDKNEKKIISNFCKQVIRQMEGDEKFVRDINSYNSIIDKISRAENGIKLTKEEKTKLVFQLKENTKFLKTKMEKSWIIKKWFYKTMFNQYNNLLEKHFLN